jgi:hypothetical protein
MHISKLFDVQILEVIVMSEEEEWEWEDEEEDEDW